MHINQVRTITMNAAQQIIENEARALHLSASILGETLAEKREVLEQIVDAALKQLYAAQ